MKTMAASSDRHRAGLGEHWFALSVALPFVVLGLGWLLPETGAGAGVRLAGAAAIVLLVPGLLVQRAVGWPAEIGIAVAGALAWSLVLFAAALALTLLVDGSLSLTLILVAGAALAAAVVALRRPGPSVERDDGLAALGVACASLPLAAGAWYVARVATGDAPFHVAAARKLEEFATLDSLESVGQFSEGALHPGYAFPLWHGVLAAIARLSGIDVTGVVVHLGPVLTPLAVVIAYGAGVALFRSWAGGVALASAYVGLVALIGERLGLLEGLSDPEAVARGVLVPGLLGLVFAYARDRSRATLATIGATALVLAVVHPNYAPYAAALVAGCLAARLVVVRRLEETESALAATLGVVALASIAYIAWLWPTASDTVALTAGAAGRARDLANYPGFFLGGPESLRVNPEVLARPNGLFLLALLAIPFAAFAARRLWSSLVLGGSLLILTTVLVPQVFTVVADLASIAQARRLVFFLPLSFALAGAAVLIGRFRLPGVAGAFAVGLVASLTLPAGEARAGGWPAWFALGGAAAGLALAAWRRPAGPDPSAWAAAVAVALVLPFAAVAAVDLEQEEPDPLGLSPGLVAALRSETAPGDVVLARDETSYRVAAQAPVYIVAAPITHTTDTGAARARERLADTGLFFAPESSTATRLSVLDKYGVSWLVLDKSRSSASVIERVSEGHERVYEDGRFVLLRIQTP
ncbi:MAG TPA: hypothetical protein VD769_05325 [Gaiellaceae bacterium]|nr:hypothetical protein [Gaiellaceae bacterium]